MFQTISHTNIDNQSQSHSHTYSDKHTLTGKSIQTKDTNKKTYILNLTKNKYILTEKKNTKSHTYTQKHTNLHANRHTPIYT